jgi:DHA1 family tetracycline resistance protein-like MFS transporter
MPIVYLTVFLDLLGFGLILPLLPYYAQTFGATGLTLGVMTTAYSAAQFLGAPIMGALSDRYGRRPILLMTLLGSAVSLTCAGLATNLLQLTLARLVAGLCGGSIAAAQAFIADVTTPETRAKHMGILGACIGLGFVLGPAMGAALAPYGFSTAAYAAAGLAGLNFLWGLFKLPETRLVGKNAASSAFSLAVLLHALRAPMIRPILGATFLTTVGFVAMETTYPLLGSRFYGVDARDLGKIFTFIGVIMVLIQGGLLGRWVKRFGEFSTAITGMVVNAVALAALPFASSLSVSIALLGCLALGQALSSPTLSTILSRSASQENQGSTLGLGQSLAAFARAIGPLIAGILFDLRVSMPYVLGGFLTMLGAWWIFSIRAGEPLSRLAVRSDSGASTK